jgi:tRNA pseudouridine38-40 synthase
VEVCGSGFLYNMVRIIAGTLVEVGRGRNEPASVRQALATRDRTLAGPTLPAHGLRLEWITYAGRDGGRPPGEEGPA